MISLKNNVPKLETETTGSISSFVFFAPIASYPAHNGGAIRSLRLFEEVASQTGGRATMVGANFTLYIEGRNRFFQRRISRPRSRIEGALRSLVFRDHYLRAKQMTNSIVQEFLREVARMQPDFVLMSYLYSASLLPYLKDQQVLIDTHNNDWEWFNNLRTSSLDPLKRIVCRNSLRQTDRYMDGLTGNVSLVHVSNRDRDTYQKRRPDLKHFVVPNGCDLIPRKSRPNYEARPIRLIFVGSLSSKMNIDALENFSRQFWPHLNGISTLQVAGSNPPSRVEALCQKNGWELSANVNNDELTELYEKSHFAILPFAYGCGSKLKLAEACGRGLPVLSTGPGTTGVETDLPANVFVSDKPEDWAATVRSMAMSEEMEKDAARFAYLHSWEMCATILLDSLSSEIESETESVS